MPTWNRDDFEVADSASGITADSIESHPDAALQGYRWGDIQKDLVAYYPMEQGQSTHLHDGALDNHGVINGATWVATENGQALDFDGADDEVDLPFNISDVQSDITVSAWFKLDAVEDVTLYGAQDASSNEINLRVDSSGFVDFYTYDGTSAYIANGTTGISAGKWYHAVGTYSQSSGYKVYLNGSIDGSTTTTTFATKTQNDAIGNRRSANNSYHVNGKISSVRVYSRALSPAEVRALYALGSVSTTTTQEANWDTASDWDAAVSESGVIHESVTNTDHNNAGSVKQGYAIANPYLSANLVGYYPLHEDSGGTAYDFSGNSKDGTISGPVINQGGILGTSSYSFDGTDDIVDIPNNFGVFGGSHTVSAWIYPDTVHTCRFIISAQGEYDWKWGVKGDGNFTFVAWDGGTAHEITSPYSTGSWQHWVGVWDSTSGMYLYENGNQVASNTFTGNVATTGRNNAIGGENTTWTEYFDGRIADARIYDDALTSSEVQTLYDVVATNGTLTTGWQ